MRKIRISNTYKKDLKQALKQGWSGAKIDEVIDQLKQNDILDPSLKDHPLQGEFRNFRECHVFGDLVIVYQRDDEFLDLFRIGRHQDLFKNY